MECNVNEHTDSLFTPPIEPGFWVKYRVNDSASWSQAKCILSPDYCENTRSGRMLIGTIQIKQYFKTQKISLSWWLGGTENDLQKWGKNAIIEFYPRRVVPFFDYCRKKLSGLPNEYNIYLSCKFDRINGRQYFFEFMPPGSEKVCDSGIINTGKISSVKRGKRELFPLKKEKPEDVPLSPQIFYELSVKTTLHRAESLYRAKVLLNCCVLALLAAAVLWGTVSLWGSPYNYAGAVFHWIWMNEYHYPIEIINWAASAFFLIPAAVIMWGKKFFWRTFLRWYSLLAIIVCCVAAFYWHSMEDSYSYWATIVSPGKILWAISVIFAGIFYAARNRELWGGNTCTLSQLKLMAAHYQNLTTVTQEKFLQHGKQSFCSRWFSVSMVLFYCVCAVWLYGGCHIIKKSCYRQTASGKELYEEAQNHRQDNEVCKARKLILLKQSAEKDYLPAMLDLSYQYLWSWVDEGVEMNPDYDLERGVYWVKRAISISNPATGELIERHLNNSFWGLSFTGERSAVLEEMKTELANHLKSLQKNQSGN